MDSRDALREERGNEKKVRMPKYKIEFASEDLRQQASPEYTRNHQSTSFWENSKAEIIVGSLVILAFIIIIIVSVNFIKKRRRSILRYASGSQTMTNSSSEGNNTCSSPNQTGHSLKSQSQISSAASPVFNNYNQSAIIISPAHPTEKTQPEMTQLIDSPYLASVGNVDLHADSKFNNSLKIDTAPVSAYSYTSPEKPMIRCLNSPDSVKYNQNQYHQNLNSSLSPKSLVQNRSFGMDACLNEFSQRNSEKFEV